MVNDFHKMVNRKFRHEALHETTSAGGMVGLRESRYTYSPSPSRKSVRIDPNEVIYRTSSLALIHAKQAKTDPAAAAGQQTSQSELVGARRVVQYMHDLWTRGDLCDVTLKTRDGDLQAHRFVIGAFSDTQSRLFLAQRNTQISLDLSEFSSDVVQSVIRFCYTTELLITEQTLRATLGVALCLGMDTLIERCLRHLETCDVDTVLLHHSIAQQYGLDEIRTKCLSFIHLRFVEVSQSQYFLRLPVQELLELVCNSGLVVAEEIDLFLAIIRWTDANKQGRVQMLPALLGCVQFAAIPAETLVLKVGTVSYMSDIPACTQMLYRAMCYHALTASGSHLAAAYAPATSRQPRLDVSLDILPEVAPCGEHSNALPEKHQEPVNLTDAYVSATSRQPRLDVSLGSFSDVTPCGEHSNLPPEKHQVRSQRMPNATSSSVTSQISTSSLFTSNWPPAPEQSISPHDTSMPPAPEQSISCQATSMPPQAPEQHAGSVVIVGGIDLRSPDPDFPGRNVFAYDEDTDDWCELTPLPQYIHHHGTCSLNGRLYVVGGAVRDSDEPDDLGTATNAVYVYDPYTEHWSQADSMLERRAYVGLAEYDGCLYAVGGEDEQRNVSDTIERYDPLLDKWSYVVRMPGGGRIGAAVATHRGQLYVVGGYNIGRSGSPVIADVLCLDLDQQHWVAKTPLTIPRCHASLVEAQGCLYLIGGRAMLEECQPPISSLSMVEIYDDENDAWVRVADLRVPRHDAGCTANGSYIFVAGGMKTPSPFCLQSVEVFDVEIGNWIPDVNGLPNPATGIACCTLEGLS